MKVDVHTCHICGRTGNWGFRFVDRYADGTEAWRCMRELACHVRAARADRVRARAKDREERQART